MSILAEYRWYFLIGAEIVFWLSAIGFFLLRYGFRLKKDLKKLDIFAQKLVAKWRNEPAPIMEEHVELTGMAYAKQEIKNWVLHLTLFVVVHILFFFLYGFVPFEQWHNWLETGIVLNEPASRVSQVWAIILLVDTVISFSYVLFPKKEKGKEKLPS